MNVQSAAQALGGDVAGRGSVLCPGPGHSPRDRSLSVTFDDNAPDGFITFSHANDDFAACRDHVRQMLGLDGFTGSKRRPVVAFAPRPVAPDPVAVQRLKFAASLWQEARAIGGTVVERYLTGRGIVIPSVVFAGHALRFHPSCPFRLESGETIRLPAMLGAMVGITSNEFQGVHRTALSADGSGKAQVRGLADAKKMLGSNKGAVVKLSPDDAVTGGLSIAEGIETSLAVMGNFGILPVWSTMTAGTLAGFPVLSGVECLSIFADNDKAKMQAGRLRQAGNEAARKCADTWAADGRESIIWTPPDIGTDFNDICRRAAA
ncbi:MAG: virulence-associated protein E [Mesorhizobium sp.]|nr:MAG: virulence-associated protein E [Mesorhizobium sp.]